MEGTTMDQKREVDVPTLLSTIAQQLDKNRDHLNRVDGAGTHGQRMAAAFDAAATAADKAGTNDAGKQLLAAARAMRVQGKGKAASFYADGLEQAAHDFSGQKAISSDNLLPFLQSFLGGVESNNPAKPGQGTMIDAIQPAVTALDRAKKAGQPMSAGLLQSLLAAITGTQSTATTGGTVDPGAASATNVIGGIVAALAPTLINMLFSHAGSAGTGGTGGTGGTQQGGLGGLLGGLLGGQGMQGGQQQDTGQGGGGMDLGGLLGSFMGSQGYQGDQQQGTPGDQQPGAGFGGILGVPGGQGDQQQGSGSMDWVNGLLGGLMGGTQSS